MTCEPLTEDHGKGVLMSFLAASPVRISAVQEEAQESTEKKADSGEKWPGSFAKYDQDTSTWRTHQCLLLGGYTEFSETWPRWGSMQNGECWERTMLVPTTGAKESGLLPTPVASDVYHQKNRYAQGGTPLSMVAGGKLNPTWVAWLMEWPLGWTDLSVSAMDKYQQWRQLHSDY